MLAVKSNEFPLYDDWMAIIEAGKNYIVLVDDAKELLGLRYVLDYIPKAAVNH